MPNDTMLSSFTITAKTRSFQLDPQGKGVCTFVIANSGKAALEGRVRLTPTGQNPAVAEWLAITEPTEQAYKPNEERSYSVNIIVPADAPGGTYLFRAEAYSVANPNDDYIGGPEFSFTVMRDAPIQPSKGFPLWIPFTALALVVAIAALVAVFVMNGGEPEKKEATLVAVAGLPEAEAEKKLVDLGLNVKSTYEQTDKVPEGQVISQEPAINDHDAAKNVLTLPAVVTLTVARKLDTPMATVPSVKGLTIAEAQKVITDAKLVLGVIGEKEEGTGEPGHVLEQSPDANTANVVGSAVSLTVKAKPAPTGPVEPSWTGTMRVRVNVMGDVDTGKECDRTTLKNADFLFRANIASERFLDAQNGTSFGFPAEATMASCSEAIRLAPVATINLATIKPGKLIAIRTTQGRYVLTSLGKEIGSDLTAMELRYQYFPLRIFVPVIRDIKILQVQPVRPLSVAPVAPVRVMAQPALVKPVEPPHPVMVKPAIESAASKTEKKEVLHKELLIR